MFSKAQRGKKGQVTIFVILALVVIIGVGLALFLLRSQGEKPVDQFTKDVTTAQTAFKPVQGYVENCIEIVGRDALDLLGSKGGYIEPFSGKYVVSKNYEEGFKGDSDGVLLGTTKDSFIPYWYQSTSPLESDKISMKVDIPSTYTMEEEIADYVDENLNSCLNNLEDLSKNGFVLTRMDEPKTQVKILDEEVLIKTKMKTIIEKDSTSQEFENFLVREQIPLGKYILKAKLILFNEYENQYLENLMMNLIGFYGRIDSNSLPPISQQNDKQATVVWTQYQINERIKSLLDSYVQLFRFQGTKNAQLFFTKEGSSTQETDFYNSFLLNAFVSEDPNLEINHIYLHNDIYSHVNSPNHNGEVITIQPESEGKWVLKSSGVESMYKSYYDVTYPVIVELKESNLSDGSTYTFMFAMEANIRNNRNGQEYLKGEGPIDWDPATVQAEFTELGTKDDEVKTVSGKVLNLPPLKNFFNDEAQKISGELTIKTYNQNTGEPIDGVNIQLGIGDYASTRLGTTSFDVYGDAIFKGKAPIVTNGYLEFDKEGYHKKYLPITTSVGVKQDIGHVGLEKICTKKLQIKIINQIPPPEENEEGNLEISPTLELFYKANGGGVLDTITKALEDDSVPIPTLGLPRNLTDNEEVFVFFTKIPEKNDLAPYSTQATLNSTTGRVDVDLVPGKYSVYGLIIDNEGVIVPEKSKDICADEGITCSIFTSKEDRYIPKEPIVMKPAMWGGIDFGEKRPWLINYEDTCSKDSYIELKLLKLKPPKNIDSLGDLGRIEELTDTYRAALLPEIIKFDDVEENGG